MVSLPLVAPYVGAWIETATYNNLYNRVMSHPTWVRGLKPKEVTTVVEYTVSHPTWVRGLKLLYLYLLLYSSSSHPTWVRGLKLAAIRKCVVTVCRTLRGCVD